MTGTLHTLRATPSDELRRHPYLSVVARYWFIVLGATVAGGLLALGLSNLVSPAYSARSTLYFSIAYGDSGNDLNQGSAFAQSQMLSFVELGRSEAVLEPVIAGLELNQSTGSLASRVDVSSPQGTAVIDITATSGDPQLAADIADATAASLTAAVKDVAPREESGRSTVTVRLVENATVPTVPASPNTRVDVVAGALLGLLASLLGIVLARMLATRVRDEQAVREATGLPVLARVQGGLDATPTAVGYGRLAAALEAISPAADTAKRGSGKTAATRPTATRVLVASTNATEGSGTVARTLALSLANNGYTAALLSLAGDITMLSNPAITVVGPLDAHGTRTMRAALAPTDSHDFVIIDAPALKDSAAALNAGRIADAVVVVVGSGLVHQAELRSTVEQLVASGAEVLGSVLVERPRTATTGYLSGTNRAQAKSPAQSRQSLPILEHNET